MKKVLSLALLLVTSFVSANELVVSAAIIEAAKECNKSGRSAYYNDRGYWQKINLAASIEALNYLIATAEMNLLMEGVNLDKEALMEELKVLGPIQSKNLQSKGIIRCN